MKIGCVCGNTLRDQTDYIPYKAYAIADQDYEELVSGIVMKLEQACIQSPQLRSETNIKDLISQVIYFDMAPFIKNLYQCRNCGRIFVEDPEDKSQLQIFKPEAENWKKVFASTKGEDSKPWERNLVGHWDTSQMQGRLWYDPPADEKGGYETFATWEDMQKRYFELFELFRSQHQLHGARLGLSNQGEPVHDIHRWAEHDSD